MAGRTVLLVEHNLSVVQDLATRVTVLARGAVLAEGSYAEVSRDPRSSRRTSERRRDDARARPELLRVASVHAFYGESHVSTASTSRWALASS